MVYDREKLEEPRMTKIFFLYYFLIESPLFVTLIYYSE